MAERNCWFRIPGRLVILGVRYLYQRGIGRCLPKVCIYEPSCSQYMIEAIETHGLIRGFAMGCWRICRCHPFAQGGWDPVPGREVRNPDQENTLEQTT